MYDLIIIGGGPAGTAAAISAARSGAQVLLLERSRFPRHKVCGEFVSGESLDLLSRLISGARAALLRDSIRISRSRVFIDDKELALPIDPAAASIARYDLDLALWESAAQMGVDARQQLIVQGIEGRGPFHVITGDGDFEARAVINASGRWSNLSQISQQSESRTRWIGLKGHFAEPRPEPSVDLYFFKGGYCGVSPVNLDNSPREGRVNVCAMLQANVASKLSEVFKLNSALEARSREWQPLSDAVSTSPLIFRRPEPVCDGMLMAGDAAAFVDPFVGDGISLALRSGALAANCLAPFFGGQISLEAAAANYQRAYEGWLGPVFRSSAQVRRLVGLPRAIRAPLLRMLQKSPSVTRYLVSRTR